MNKHFKAVHVVKKTKEPTEDKEAKEAKEKMDLKKNKNVTEAKDVSFSWIRKILEDKITSKAGKDEQAIDFGEGSAIKYKFTMQTSNRHVANVHEGKKDFKCTETACDKSFGNKAKMKVHVRTVHQNLKLYKCTICEKSYKEKVTLTRHVYEKHGDGQSKPFKCNVCDSGFSFKNKLTRHLKTHGKKIVENIEKKNLKIT